MNCYTKSLIEYYINKNRYKSVMKQLKSYNLYNENNEVIKFAKDAIIG